MMKENDNQIIKLLMEHKDKLQTITDNRNATDIGNWLNSFTLLIKRVYEINSPQVEVAEKLHCRSTYKNVDRNKFGKFFLIDDFKKSASSLIDSLVQEINTFGIPEKLENKSDEPMIKIVNNLHQNQNINLNVLISTLKDEIPASKYREIEEIANSEEHKASKLTKIREKLKDTGIDVVSSTLSKLLLQLMGI